jgi:hypothetical protein
MPESFTCEHCRHEVAVVHPLSVCGHCRTTYRHETGEAAPSIHSSPVRFRQLLALLLLLSALVAFLADRPSAGLLFGVIGWSVLLWCALSSGVVELRLGHAFQPWKIHRIESPGLFALAIFLEGLCAVGFGGAWLLSLTLP